MRSEPPDREVYDRLKAAGFAWAPKQDQFIAPMSTPACADLCIELAGEIGDDDDASLIDRAEDRADRFDVYRDKRTFEAERATAQARRVADGIPFGQPILVGHHSERYARKDAERIQNGMRKAVQAFDAADYWKRRAVAAILRARYKERPEVRARRIKTIEADRRKQERVSAEALVFLSQWRRGPAAAWWPCARTVRVRTPAFGRRSRPAAAPVKTCLPTPSRKRAPACGWR